MSRFVASFVCNRVQRGYELTVDLSIFTSIGVTTLSISSAASACIGCLAGERHRLRKLLSVSDQVLVEVGPELIGIFVPFGKIITLFAIETAKKVGWTEKLEALAKRPKPLEVGAARV